MMFSYHIFFLYLPITLYSELVLKDAKLEI
jgi:hypothetical protein